MLVLRGAAFSLILSPPPQNEFVLNLIDDERRNVSAINLKVQATIFYEGQQRCNHRSDWFVGSTDPTKSLYIMFLSYFRLQRNQENRFTELFYLVDTEIV